MFDLTTVFYFGALSCAVCAMIVFSLRRFHRDCTDAVGWATGAEICMGVAMLLMALQGLVPPSVSGLLANCLGVTASVLIYESTRRMTKATGGVHQTPIILASAIGAQALFGMLITDEIWQIAVTAVIQGIFVAACIPLLRDKLHSENAMAVRWGIGFCALYMAAHTGRAVMNGVLGGATSDQSEQGAALVLIAALLISLVPMLYAMVMIGLINGRVIFDYRRLADVDGLTGLQTRRSFFNRANAAIRTPRVGQEQPALFMLDLDKFKSVNDLHGHAHGDRVLVEFSRILSESAPKHSLLGRYGGEEFCALVFPGPGQSALHAANSICRAVAAWRGEPGAGPARMTVSIGVATLPGDGASLNELLVAADRRLYMAKTTGRNRVVGEDLVAAEDSLIDLAHAFPI